jgi:hypothetical protein
MSSMSESAYKKSLHTVAVKKIRTSAEDDRWNHLMEKYHDRGFERLSGESMKYVAEMDGEWVALIGWGSAALKCAVRDRWMGWQGGRQWARLRYVANNQRYLILPWIRIKNLASGILALNTKRLSQDWMESYGHGVLIAETFVEKQRFCGCCYKAAGWRSLGETSGYGKNANRYYYHGVIKEVFVKELAKGALNKMTGENLSADAGQAITVNSLAIGGLIERLGELNDPRGKQGKQHPKPAVMAISILSALAGIKSYSGMEDFAESLTQEQRKILGCKFDEEKQEYLTPSDSTFLRVLQDTDEEHLDRISGEWTAEQTECGGISLDGKVLNGARLENGKKVNILAAVAHGSGEVLAQEKIDEKSNEIPAAIPLLDKIDIEGKVITADALHTHAPLADYIVEDRAADYVFIVKDNQSTLKNDISLLEGSDFSPCGDNL